MITASITLGLLSLIIAVAKSMYDYWKNGH